MFRCFDLSKKHHLRIKLKLSADLCISTDIFSSSNYNMSLLDKYCVVIFKKLQGQTMLMKFLYFSFTVTFKYKSFSSSKHQNSSYVHVSLGSPTPIVGVQL